MQENDLLTIRELARKLNISTRQVYRLIDQGLPFHIVGERKRFDINIVMEWINKQNKQ